jgi:2-phosphosulfolactate phosphatase
MMTERPHLHTCVSPSLLHLYNLHDAVVVVIDVFRATSTIAAALHNGAARIIPVDAVDKCIELGAATGCITAGERDGKVVPGLQHGNSPMEYPREFVEGKTLVLTTTNGTKLLHMSLAQGASDIITGSFPNLGAVCKHLVEAGKNVILGCAAWKDRVNMEDTLFAGAVISRVKEYFTIHCDSSLAAETLYHSVKNDLWAFSQKTTHYHRLARYGLEKDMQYCLSEDVANVLPVYRNEELVRGEGVSS